MVLFEAPPWIVLASALGACSPHAVRDRSEAQHPRVLFTLEGEDYDLLGRGLLALPDIDRDGLPDLLLVARGYAVACSGKDGCVIYRLELSEDSSPDALPRHPALVGDVDGDGISDFGLEGECAFHDPDPKLPHVDIHSSVSGRLLARYGGTPLGVEPTLVANRAIGASDLDGDGRAEILLEIWGRGRDETRVHTVGSDIPMACALGSPQGTTPDVDGDGIRDLLLSDDAWYRDWRGAWGWIVSGAKGSVISSLPNPGFQGRLRAANQAGDVDLDGFPDVLFVHGSSEEGSYADDGQVAFECHLLSGRDGSVLHLWTEATQWRGRLLDAGGLDDLDGDGVREVFTLIHDIVGAESRIRIDSGSTRDPLLELSSKNGFEASRVITIGDLDRDAVSELVLGTPAAGREAGRVTVYSLGRRLR